MCAISLTIVFAALQTRSCPNLAEYFSRATAGSSATASSTSSSSTSTRSSRTGRVRRQVSCSALLIPVDPSVVGALDKAGQSNSHEMVVQSALHVSAAQRFECMQRYHSSDFKTFGLLISLRQPRPQLLAAAAAAAVSASLKQQQCQRWQPAMLRHQRVPQNTQT
jgi:hypothetical protein